MLYFAYGSNLSHRQMKCIRCAGCKYVKNAFLKNYQLSFCHSKKENVFGYANVHKKRGARVPGAIWEITKKHEKILDEYEEYPKSYLKKYFILNGKKVMFYIMDTCAFRNPSERYVNIIKSGYENCNLDVNYLKGSLSYYNIKYKIKWK